MFRVADLPNLFFCTALTLTAVYLLVRFGNGRPARQLRRAVVPVALLAALALLASCEDRKAPPRKSVAEAPAIQRPFEKFQKKLQFDWDDEYFYVGSDAFPDHPMMIGITAWQQQVPLPQPYTGSNAWRIPLKPVPAKKPISTKTSLFRGAIAIAVNGVPIFNALNNRGEDAFLAGELDEYGGHCGRGDDYHYHIAPVHLEKTVGRGNPIAYGLDGYPLLGHADANGREPDDLDECSGRTDADGQYRYYATRKYPYTLGGMHGTVAVRGDQIDPQPKDSPVRRGQEPLRGAKISDFSRDDKARSYTLKYELRRQTHVVKYEIQVGGEVKFTFVDERGNETNETYRRRK